MIFLNKWLSSHEDVVVFWKDVKESKLSRDSNNLFTETFARCHERYENKAKICEKAEFTRGK